MQWLQLLAHLWSCHGLLSIQQAECISNWSPEFQHFPNACKTLRAFREFWCRLKSNGKMKLFRGDTKIPDYIYSVLYSRYNEKSWNNPVAKFQFSSVFHYFWGGCNPSCLKTWNPAASAADFVACRCVSLACPGTVSTQPNCKGLWAHLIICSVDLCGTEAEKWSDMIWQTDTNCERPRNQKKDVT